jgi:hypothetical protein
MGGGREKCRVLPGKKPLAFLADAAVPSDWRGLRSLSPQSHPIKKDGMRRIIIFGAALAVAGLCVGALQASEEDQVPKRKPGLWEIVTVAPASGMTKSKVCVGEDDNMVTPENAGDCSKPTTTRQNEGLTIDVVGISKQGKQSISTSFTGDFDTRYHATLKTAFDPPIGGIPHMGLKLDGKYLGPDCEGAGTGKN